MKKLFLIVLFTVLFLPLPVAAFDMRAADSVTVAEKETVSGSLFAAGEKIEIKGTIDGDLYCAGQSVVVTGTVTGDILCAAQRLSVLGTAKDDLRLAGQEIELKGDILGNVIFAAQTAWLRESSVAGELAAFGQTIDLEGTVGKSVLVKAETVTLNGSIGQDADFEAQTIRISEGSSITGSLVYAMNDGSVPESVVGGDITRRTLPSPSGSVKDNEPRWSGASIGRSILPFIILSYLVVFLLPGLFGATLKTLEARPWRSLGVGVLALLFVPGIFIGLAVTIIGIPFALAFAVTAAILIYLVRIVVAYRLGQFLVAAVNGDAVASRHWPIIVGVPVFYFVTRAAFIGPLLHFLAVALGLGALIVSGIGSRRPVRKKL